MGFLETKIPRSAQARVASRLREGSGSLCSFMIDLLKLLRLLARTSGLQEFMARFRKTQRHASSCLVYIGAFFPDRACLTDLFRKEDLDNRLSLRVSVQVPGVALLPLWTGDSLLLPVDLEVFDIQCPRGASLPGSDHYGLAPSHQCRGFLY